MGSLSDTYETLVGKALLQNTSLAAGATLYLALGTAASDTSFTELANSNNYSRTAVTMSAANWPEDAVTKGRFTNNIAITTATASGSWGTPATFALTTSATYGAGNVVCWGQIDSATQQPISSGQAVDFAVGTLVITID